MSENAPESENVSVSENAVPSQDMLEIGTTYDICGAGIAGTLFDCEDFYFSGEPAWDIIDFATTTVLESVLHCDDSTADLSQIQDRFSDVGAYFETL